MKPLWTALLAMLIALPMLGQEPPTPPSPAEHAQHHLKMMTTLLNLTPAQQQQAATIFTKAAQADEPIHQSMKTAHENLHAAIKGNDLAAMEQAANAIGSNMTQFTLNRARSEAAFYQILTPEQQAKLSEFENDHMGPMGGPEGFHGHGPH